MPRFIPFIQTSEIRNFGERTVAEALEQQLPPECVVYHSYPWLREDRHDSGFGTVLREGEADFVIVHPQAGGLLVLEVKEGEIVYDPSTLEWSRRLDDGALQGIRDPFQQGQSTMHHLAGKILELGFPGVGSLRFSFGYAVVFPDCEYAGPPPRDAENSIIFGAGDIERLGKGIFEVIRKWSRQRRPPRLGSTDLEAIRKGLMPSFQLLPVLHRRVAEEEAHLVRMTEEQLGLLDFLEGHPRAAIEGVAGSGKTLLALAQAQRFAEAEKKTLLLCYNKGLSKWLQDHFPRKFADRVCVGHFHGLAALWCQEAGIPFDVPGNDPPGAADYFWRHQAPDLLLQAADKLGLAFDAIVVDEGQDFAPEWWETIELLSGRGREEALYIFYDPAQNLYIKQGVRLPVDAPAYKLKTNCRNTVAIARYCGEVIGREIRTHSSAPAGQECVIFRAKDSEEQRRKCDGLVTEWVKKGKLKPSQVAILGPRRIEHSVLRDVSRIGGQKIVSELGKWEANAGVLYSTIRSFKGLEADAVVLLDLHEIDRSAHFTNRDLYVAASRAKHLLALLQMEQQAHGHEKSLMNDPALK